MSSLLLPKPILVQIVVYYSDTRKQEMAIIGEKECDALFTLVKDKLDILGIKITNVLVPHGDDRTVDLVLEAKVPNKEILESLTKSLDTITENKAGTKKISVFILDN